MLWEDTASDGTQQLAWGRKPWPFPIPSLEKELSSQRETSGQAKGVSELKGDWAH